MEKETQLVVITDSEKDSGGRLLPEVRERVCRQVEDYINEKKKLNVSEISRSLGVSWITAENIVTAIAERWRQEDSHKIQQYRRSLVESSGTFIMEAEKQSASGELSFDRMEKMIDMFAKLISIVKIENQPVANADDASKVVSVHFNNLNMTPSMAAEIEKNRNGNSNSTGDTGSEPKVV